MAESTARDEQAARVWTAIRDLTDSYPPKSALRGALNLGRGSGRVKALLWLAEGPLSLSGIAEAVGVHTSTVSRPVAGSSRKRRAGC